MWSLIKFFKKATGNYVEVSADNPLPTELTGSNVTEDGEVKVVETDIEWQKPGDIQSVYADPFATSTTPLGISATYTSATLDMLAGNNACTRLVVNYAADQDGTLTLEVSLDGSTWHAIAALTAGKTGEMDKRIALRYVRVKLANGAVAQTKFIIAATRMAL